MGRDAAAVVRDFIADVESCSELSSTRLRLLEHLGRLVPIDSAMLMPISPSEPPILRAKTIDLSTVYRANQARYARELSRGNRIGGADGAYVDTDVYSVAERSRFAFFNEILAPQGITHRLVVHLAFRGNTLATVHLARHGRRGFARRDLHVMRMLAPLAGLSYATLPVFATHAPSSPLDELSAQQRRIAAYVRRGYQNKEIAALLGVSPHTVRNQLTMMFRKLDIDTRAGLAVLAERAGLELPARRP